VPIRGDRDSPIFRIAPLLAGLLEDKGSIAVQLFSGTSFRRFRRIR
jgi:hypothetical protein